MKTYTDDDLRLTPEDCQFYTSTDSYYPTVDARPLRNLYRNDLILASYLSNLHPGNTQDNPQHRLQRIYRSFVPLKFRHTFDTIENYCRLAYLNSDYPISKYTNLALRELTERDISLYDEFNRLGIFLTGVLNLFYLDMSRVDPYFYTADNRPLKALLENDNIFMDSLLLHTAEEIGFKNPPLKPKTHWEIADYDDRVWREEHKYDGLS